MLNISALEILKLVETVAENSLTKPLWYFLREKGVYIFCLVLGAGRSKITVKTRLIPIRNQPRIIFRIHDWYAETMNTERNRA